MTALAKETAIDPYFPGERRIFSVKSAIRRNIVPRRHISVIILHKHTTLREYTIQKRLEKWRGHVIFGKQVQIHRFSHSIGIKMTLDLLIRQVDTTLSIITT